MAITHNELEILSGFIGEGNLYVGVTNPADGALLDLTNGVPTGGANVGPTTGETAVEVEQSIEGFEIEQTTGKVAPRVKEESAKVKATLALPTHTNFKRALAVATSGIDATAGVAYAKVGGKTRVKTVSITVVSPVELEDGSTKYVWVHIYRAVAKGSKAKFKRGENQVFEVEFEAYHDPTRSKGDQLLQYCMDSDIPGVS